MRKILNAALAAATLVGAVAATTVPAQAQPWRYGGYGYYGGYYHHNDVAGPALAAGILGLAVGAAVASSSRPYYAYPSYGYGYGYAPSYYGYAPGYYGYAPAPSYRYAPSYGYAPGYGYGGGYCQAGRWVWDPYVGRRVWVNSAYPC
jgi:opacity protein-like surface antigen